MAPVHLLVIPKEHYDDLIAASGSDVITAMYDLVDRFLFNNKLAFEHDLAGTGFRTIINTGANAGQTVKHLHMHLLGGARLKNDFGA